MDHYLALKHLHITLVATSLGLFVLRGLWMLAGSVRLQQRWVKIAPHIIDTALLAAGVTLTFLAHWNPVQQPWLAAKLVALVFYIGFGTLAFKAAHPAVRRLAFGAALLCAAYMVKVAISKTPWPL